MAQYYEFGLSNVYVSQRQESEGVITYATPVAWEGAQSLTVTRENQTFRLRADNKNFIDRIISSGRTGSLGYVTLPDWVKIAYLGYKLDSDNKLVETDAEGSACAILFQVETDTTPKYYCIYNVKMALTDNEHNTTEENDLSVSIRTLDLTISGEDFGTSDIAYISEVDSLTVAPTVPTPATSN